MGKLYKLYLVNKYNPNKSYIIKKYKSGNYYFNESIGGIEIYSRYEKTTKEALRLIGFPVYIFK
jgi:hypothetical protein